MPTGAAAASGVATDQTEVTLCSAKGTLRNKSFSSVPTVKQPAPVPVTQETPANVVVWAPFVEAVGSIDQLVPFQASTAPPTATQSVADVHDTPSRAPDSVPPGLGGVGP